MGEKVSGPLCAQRVGSKWVDGGTLALTKHSCPGPVGVGSGADSSVDSPQPTVPDASLLEKIRQELIIGSIIGLRRAAASVNPIPSGNAQLEVNQDEQQAYMLLAHGEYEKAFEVATGLQEYFKIHRVSKATGASGSETTAAMIGHVTGFNQATSAVTGKDIKGKELDVIERIMTGLDGLTRIVSTALLVRGVVGGLGGGLMKLRIVSPVYRLAGRDIVIVETSVGRQAFYRSSGHNSAMPGRWLPVDEFRPADGWFNKANYTMGANMQRGQSLERVGTEEFRRISKQLGEMHIPQGSQVPAGRHESAEATLNRILDFFNARLTPYTRNRPVQ